MGILAKSESPINLIKSICYIELRHNLRGEVKLKLAVVVPHDDLKSRNYLI